MKNQSGKLSKRNTVAAPKKTKEAPEPDTYTCKGVETAVTEKDKESLLSKCLRCVNNAHSEVDHLCYDCHKQAAGFVYDEDSNRYIQRKTNRK